LISSAVRQSAVNVLDNNRNKQPYVFDGKPALSRQGLQITTIPLPNPTLPNSFCALAKSIPQMQLTFSTAKGFLMAGSLPIVILFHWAAFCEF
jgi:hypothetical protein